MFSGNMTEISTVEGNTENTVVSKTYTKKCTGKMSLPAAVSSTGERQPWFSTSKAILSDILGLCYPQTGQILPVQGPPLRT